MIIKQNQKKHLLLLMQSSLFFSNYRNSRYYVPGTIPKNRIKNAFFERFFRFCTRFIIRGIPDYGVCNNFRLKNKAIWNYCKNRLLLVNELIYTHTDVDRSRSLDTHKVFFNLPLNIQLKHLIVLLDKHAFFSINLAVGNY